MKDEANMAPFSNWREMFSSESKAPPGPSAYKPEECIRLDPSKPLDKTSYIAPSMWVEDVSDSGRRNFRVFNVQPTDALADWIRANMLDLERNSFYFQALCFADGKVCVLVKYNLIIGSRLLAELTEIPECAR